MSRAPNLKTLFNISAAYLDLAPELERTSEVLIPAVILRPLTTELEQLVNAILAVRANPSTADAEPPFPRRRVEFYGVQADWSTKALLNLKLLVDIQSAIDIFVQGFVRKQCYPDKGQYSQPSTRTELERIHRALWRFELCCELCRSRKSNGGFTEYGRLSGTCLNRQYNYLRTLTPWEAEELECVYDHLEGFLLGDANMDPGLECSDVDLCLELQKIIYPIATDKPNPGVSSRALSEGLVFLQRHLTLSRTDPDFVSREQ